MVRTTDTGGDPSIFSPMHSTKTFHQWLPEAEAELRTHVQYLHGRNNGRRYGVESSDLFHDVVVKLEQHNHPIPSRGKLFSLVSTTALRRLMDISEKYSFRSEFFSKPMPTRLRPQPGSSMDTVASNAPSPASQAALRDDVARIRIAVAEDPKLGALFQTLAELTEMGESVSTGSLAQHLELPPKKIRKSMEKLRSVARRAI